MTRVLITGHTGFKGSWLTVLMARLGYEVSGLALDPEAPCLFSQARLSNLCVHDLRYDIRDDKAVHQALELVQPEIVVHMAAQPLVRRSFAEPRETVTTNVMGTFNLLEAASRIDTIRASLIVTTDKVYRPTTAGNASEGDALGGDDIYSASKAMADLLTHAWARSFSGPAFAIARAGNVIGGGDYGQDRLIPDLVAALTRGTPLILRYPAAVRPWQHVLDCLSGYMSIIDALMSQPGEQPTLSWNVGPHDGDFATVAEVAEKAFGAWGMEPSWHQEPDPVHAENSFLTLSSRKLHSLGWHSELSLNDSIAWTIEWYKRVHLGEDPFAVTNEQVGRFLSFRS